MGKLIDKDILATEINKLKGKVCDGSSYCTGWQHALRMLEIELNTIETKEEDVTDKKTEWAPSKKQMDSLEDMLKWNIGDFDYQKWMEVHLLYNDLIKLVDYETNR